MSGRGRIRGRDGRIRSLKIPRAALARFRASGHRGLDTSVFSRRRAPRWAGHTTSTGHRSHKAAGRFFRANRWGRPSRLAMSGLIAAHNRERNSLANLLLFRCYSIAT